MYGGLGAVEAPNEPPSARKHHRENEEAASAPAHVQVMPVGGGAAPGDTRPLLELFASYEPDAQRIALDAIMRVHEALTGDDVAAGRPAAAGLSSGLPPSSSPGRLDALAELADTLSEDEANVLIRAIDKRRAAAQSK